MSNQKNRKVPVTIFAGYLGAGKTTVLNHILRSQGADGLALIVNDVGSVNIDAGLIRNSKMLDDNTQMVELQNGCICCTLQDKFLNQIEKLAADEKVERILVEASGVSDPMELADGFSTWQESPDCGFYLDRLVTVVDADRIYAEFLGSMKQLPEEEENSEETTDDTDPDIINLVMDQIEFCNVILLNKCDLLDESQKKEVEEAIRGLQPEAEIIECVNGDVDPDRIFAGEPFDFEKVMNSSAYQKAIAREENEEEEEESGQTDDGDALDEAGVASFVFMDKRPFHYGRFMDFVETDFPREIIRTKGTIWFSNDDVHVQLFEQAGRNSSLTEYSNWIASFPKKEQETIFKQYPDVRQSWDPKYGDRMNQLVFIGKNYDKNAILEKLTACLDA